MDNFFLLAEAVKQTDDDTSQNLKKHTNKSTTNKSITNKSTTDKKCLHKHILKENNCILCKDCGTELNRDLSYDKEWRYYGASDTRYNSDPNRCHARSSDDRTIYKDVENMGFSDRIISKANKLYQECTGKKIYRGNSRKAIVFACIFHSYKLDGKPQSCENLITIFKIDRKNGLKGLKHINLNAKKGSEVRTTYITPENLIEEIMDKFEATLEQKKDVINLYKKIKNKSSILERSRPQSVASGLVRYYILIKDKNITMEEFRNKVNLSELTINRIVKEISRILDIKN